jgi:hypothetical protein
LFLIGTQLFNTVASILLYALLCCIYAALLGVVLFYCPRLISLLKPTLLPQPQPDEQQQQHEQQAREQQPMSQHNPSLQQQTQSLSSEVQTSSSSHSSMSSASLKSKTHSKTGRALALRLVVITILCIGAFLAHAISYARLVVMPPRRVYWWWSYGMFKNTKQNKCLEIFI